MPTIKREESPEAPMASLAFAYLPDASTAVTSHPSDATLQACASVSKDSCGVEASDMNDVKPSMSLPLPGKPYIVASQALQAAPSMYYGSSPRKYKLTVRDIEASRISVPSLLLCSRLPALLQSPVATGCVNSFATTTTSLTIAEAPSLPHIAHLLQYETKVTHEEKHHLPLDKMDYDNCITDDDIILPPTTLVELQQQAIVNEYKIYRHEMVIQELTKFNQDVLQTLADVRSRLEQLESANSSARAVGFSARSRGAPDGCSRSPSPEVKGKKGKGRKELKIKVYTGPKGLGLPTPMITGPPTSGFSPFAAPLHTPLTPGRAGPPSSARKAITSINKRGVHNLDKMVPQTYAQVPPVPLTDTELIVFFFNSLSRPIVALRLYARKWGPAAISDVLNAHRSIDPPYLRNTCSVKCTTAIKKGREQYGEVWENSHRTAFGGADDAKATDLIRLATDELNRAAEDYDMRSLAVGLKKYPELGQDGGIFTRCVQYCHENKASYTLANVWELAKALSIGREPQSYPAPVPLLSNEYGRRFQDSHDAGAFGTCYDTPSRRRCRRGSSASVAQSYVSDESVIDPTSQESF